MHDSGRMRGAVPRWLGRLCAVALTLGLLTGCDSGSDDDDGNGSGGIPTNAFLSVGSFGHPMVSTDGVTWTQAGADTPQARYWNLAVGNGGVTVTGPSTTTAGGQIWRFSGFPDGIDDTVTGPFLRAITFGDGRFVGVEDGGSVYTSTDGLTFVQSGQINNVNALLEIVHGDAGYLVNAAGRGVFHSRDGTMWTAAQLPDANRISDVFFTEGRYFAMGITEAGSLALWTSTDLTNWTLRPTGVDGLESLAMAVGGGRVVVFAGGGGSNVVLRSEDLGATWTSAPGPARQGIEDIAYGRGRFVAVASSGAVAVSEDGATWALNNPNNDALYNVVFNP